jgi:hypothetical protein
MRSQSPKRQRQQAQRRKLAAALGDTACQLRTSACTFMAEAFHELVGVAQGGSRTDTRNLVPSCNRCNVFVEDYPQLAYRMRWKVRRTETVDGDGGLVPAVPVPWSVDQMEGAA